MQKRLCQRAFQSRAVIPKKPKKLEGLPQTRLLETNAERMIREPGAVATGSCDSSSASIARFRRSYEVATHRYRSGFPKFMH